MKILETDTTSSDTTVAPVVPEHTYARLSFWQCLGLGVGGIPDLGMQYAMSTMANPIFNVIYGVDPILIGIAFSLPRFWELFIDPWIGALSDRTRGRLGRRHPYMILGAILGCLTFALVWFVPAGFSPSLIGCWLIVFALAHFTAYSFFMVPYSALLGEVSMVPAERMKVMTARTAFVSVSSLLIGWLYWLCQRPCFSGPEEGMKVVGIGFGIALLAGALLPVFVCKENRKYHATGERGESGLKGLSILRELWGIKSFRLLLLAVFFLLAACLLVGNLGFYIALCFMFDGNREAVGMYTGLSATINSVAVIFFCPIVNYCARKIGEKTTLYLFMCVAMFGYVAGFWAAHPAHPYYAIVTGILGNFGLTAFWVIVPAMVGEISREHEVASGHSLYGSFYALYGMGIKIGSSVGLLFTGIVLNMTGYTVAHGVNQAARTLLSMRLLNSAGPTIGMLIAMICIYRLTRKTNRAIPSISPSGNKENG